MKIRKIEPSVGILGKILNIFSSSNKDSYSCKYINDTYGRGVKNYSTDEVKLDEKWIDGKPIYRKVIELPSITTLNQDVSISCNISNLEKILNITGLIYVNNSSGDLGIPLNFYNPGATNYAFLTFYRKKSSQLVMRCWYQTFGGYAINKNNCVIK